MKVNVLSATGQLGSRIVRELLRQGGADLQVVASARRPEKARELAGAGAEIRKADYDAPDSLEESFAGCDVVALIPTFAPVEARVQQHADALAAARKAGVRRVVFSSFATATVESEFVVAPFMVYAECKLRQSGMEWTILRSGMYADPLVDYIPELVSTGRIPYPAGEGRVSYVSRDDLARASAAACAN
jgi:NAD(P)H dehydrogenase (quinone)